MKRRTFLIVALLALQVFFVNASPVKASSVLYNSDGHFTPSNPYSQSSSGSGSLYQAPFGNGEWGVSAYAWKVGCYGTDYVDGYGFSVSSSVGHVWVQMNHGYAGGACLLGVGLPVGVARFIQGRDEGGADWNTPADMATYGRQTILSYSMYVENTALSSNPVALSEVAVLFDLRLHSPSLTKDLLIDLYVYSQCQNISWTGDPACVQEPGFMGENHPPDAEVYMWRINSNHIQGQWTTDAYDVSGIIDLSAEEAYCYELTGNSYSSQCNGFRPEAYIFQLQPLAETYLGQAGAAFDYVNLSSQSLSCSASASPTSGNQAVTVYFSSSCSGGVPSYSYYWQFNDGTGATSSLQNPTHPYYCLFAGVNAFSPTLRVTDSSGLVANPQVPQILVYATHGCAQHPSR